MRRFAFLLLLLAAAGCETPTNGPADDSGEPTGPISDIGRTEMLELYNKWGAPDDHHKFLKPLKGSWTASTKYWTTPNGDEETSSGKSEISFIQLGRFFREDFSGTLMLKPFGGLRLIGYNVYRGMYECYWTDTINTGMEIGAGTADPSGKSITFTGEADDYLIKQKRQKLRMVLTIVSDDEWKWEKWATTEGKEWKKLEVTYKRAE